MPVIFIGGDCICLEANLLFITIPNFFQTNAIIRKSFISNTNHFCPLSDRQTTASRTIKLQKVVKQPEISIACAALSCLPLNVDEHIPKSISIFHMTIRIQYNKQEID